jgi:hypothetical protein
VKALSYLLGAAIVLAVLKLTVQLAMVALALIVVVALIERPTDTLKALFAITLLGSFASHPLLGLALAIAVVIAGAFVQRSEP